MVGSDVPGARAGLVADVVASRPRCIGAQVGAEAQRAGVTRCELVVPGCLEGEGLRGAGAGAAQSGGLAAGVVAAAARQDGDGAGNRGLRAGAVHQVPAGVYRLAGRVGRVDRRAAARKGARLDDQIARVVIDALIRGIVGVTGVFLLVKQAVGDDGLAARAASRGPHHAVAAGAALDVADAAVNLDQAVRARGPGADGTQRRAARGRQEPLHTNQADLVGLQLQHAGVGRRHGGREMGKPGVHDAAVPSPRGCADLDVARGVGGVAERSGSGDGMAARLVLALQHFHGVGRHQAGRHRSEPVGEGRVPVCPG